MTPYRSFWNIFNLRSPGEANFADIIKTVTMFIKKVFEDSKKVEKLEIMYQNAIYICIFWYTKICWFPMKNADVSTIQGVCHVIHIFLALL